MANLKFTKKKKKGVSAIIGYVLLITFGIILSVIAYNYLKTYVPKEITDCPSGVNIFLVDYSCSGGDLNLTIKNNGNFNIAGYYLHAANSTEQKIATINLAKYALPSGQTSPMPPTNPSYMLFLGSADNKMEPSDYSQDSFLLPNSIAILEITPVRFEEKGNTKQFASCVKSKIRETIDCGVIKTCTDTELGDPTVLVAGTITIDGTQEKTDYCYSGGGILEYYCNGGIEQSIILGCPSGCVDGVCTSMLSEDCNDTDGGFNEYVRGYTNDIWGAKETDYCQGNSVNEWYCEDGSASMNLIECRGLCVLGICTHEQGCSDTDGGQNLSEQGSIYIDSNPTATDSCQGGTDVLEYYCDGNNWNSIVLTCADGETCFSGVCTVATSPCVDTDGGQNLGVQGTIFMDDVAIVTDLCEGAVDILEHYCDGDDWNDISLKCADGETCSDGACS